MEYGLIGEHLLHSFSKLIHESLESYKYDLKELKEFELESFLLERNFKAINVTIPYKEAVIPYLDEIDDAAKSVGAVNIIVNRNGRLVGYNSDIDGFIYLINKSGIKVEDKTVLILGKGGAAKAIKYALNKLGAKEILIASRTKSPRYISYSDIDKHQEIEVVVNATPIGMFPHNEFGFDIFDSLKKALKLKNSSETLQKGSISAINNLASGLNGFDVSYQGETIRVVFYPSNDENIIDYPLNKTPLYNFGAEISNGYAHISSYDLIAYVL